MFYTENLNLKLVKSVTLLKFWENIVPVSSVRRTLFLLRILY